MLTIGPNLGLLDNGDYGEGTYQESLRMYRALDLLVQPHVKRIDLATPPASPAEGDAYIVPSGATGAWAGKVGQVARWTARSALTTPQWEFFVPKKNWMFGVDDTEGLYVRYDGADWVALAAGGGGGYILPKATDTTLGGIKVGANLTIDGNGVLTVSAGAFETAGAVAAHELAANPHPQYLTQAEGDALYKPIAYSYTLPIASDSILGGVKVGAGLAIAGDGTLSVTGGGDYVLPVATTSVLGGVKQGANVTIAGDGTLTVNSGAFETAGAVATHAAAGDPHPQYLTAAEGNAAYEVAGAVSAHVAAGDPHPQYTSAAEAAAAAPVQQVAGKTGNVSLVKADVGLGNVDNTSDANKPISTATQTALDGKSATSHNHAGTYEPVDANIVRKNVATVFTTTQTPSNGTLTDAATIDWNGTTNGQVVEVTTAAARTFGAPTNIQAKALYLLELNSNGFTPAWNAAYKWSAGGAPSSLSAGKYVFTFIGGAGNTLIPTGPGYLTGA